MAWNGYAGKILEVDLTSGAIETVELDRTMAEQYVGGKGFGIHTIYERLPVGCDPLGPRQYPGFRHRSADRDISPGIGQDGALYQESRHRFMA